MIKKILLTTAAMLTIGASVSANASSKISENIIRGTLLNISASVNTAVSEAEALFAVNAGNTIDAYDVIAPVNSNDPGVAHAHPHLRRLTIGANYEIEIAFHGTAQSKLATSIETAAPGTNHDSVGLRNAKILLAPNYATNSTVITSWDCYTDADSYAANNITGSTGNAPASGDRSFIADLTDNAYLNLCTYIPSATESLFGS